MAECPAGAIYAADDLPEEQKQFIALNAELAKLWKLITEKKDTPPDARVARCQRQAETS